jgi:hypothetical protein
MMSKVCRAGVLLRGLRLLYFVGSAGSVVVLEGVAGVARKVLSSEGG